jgi:trehalose 6-phosphate phosphatase
LRQTRIIPHLFSESALAALRGFVDHSTLFAFDLDGTLTSISADPQNILLSGATREQLSRLIKHAPVAVITGRSRSDAQAHLGITPHFLIGNHGAEGLPGWQAWEREFVDMCVDWEKQMRQALLSADVSGITIENKGMTLSIHYRAALRRRRARSLILKGIDELVPKPRRVEGKCVENLLPPSAPDKGTAMLYLMRLSESPKGLYVGDDVTDEDVFRLEGNHLFTVRVGTGVMSRAQYELRNHKEMVRLLREINQTLTKGH